MYIRLLLHVLIWKIMFTQLPLTPVHLYISPESFSSLRLCLVSQLPVPITRMWDNQHIKRQYLFWLIIWKFPCRAVGLHCLKKKDSFLLCNPSWPEASLALPAFAFRVLGLKVAPPHPASLLWACGEQSELVRVHGKLQNRERWTLGSMIPFRGNPPTPPVTERRSYNAMDWGPSL